MDRMPIPQEKLLHYGSIWIYQNKPVTIAQSPLKQSNGKVKVSLGVICAFNDELISRADLFQPMPVELEAFLTEREKQLT
jgi:hypothetical protein